MTIYQELIIGLLAFLVGGGIGAAVWKITKNN